MYIWTSRVLQRTSYTYIHIFLSIFFARAHEKKFECHLPAHTSRIFLSVSLNLFRLCMLTREWFAFSGKLIYTHMRHKVLLPLGVLHITSEIQVIVFLFREPIVHVWEIDCWWWLLSIDWERVLRVMRIFTSLPIIGVSRADVASM